MIPMIMSMVNETIYNKMKMKSVPIYKKLPNNDHSLRFSQLNYSHTALPQSLCAEIIIRSVENLFQLTRK